MSYIVDQETGFPAPSEHDKINRAIDKYKNLLRKFPDRADANEIKFGLADLYVGRNEAGDWERAGVLYDEILQKSGSMNLRARAQVGKAELLLPGIKHENIAHAIEICHTARKTLKDDISDFFVAKTYIIEADLLMLRDAPGDHKQAMKNYEKLIKERSANWYFRARALLGRAELILYHNPKELSTAITLCERSSHLLKDRRGDYFALKSKVIEGELLVRRTKKDDFKRAEKLLKEVVTYPHAYKDLSARARLDLAEISKDPAARKYFKEVEQMEGLDPYLADKAKLVAKKFKASARKKR